MRGMDLKAVAAAVGGIYTGLEEGKGYVLSSVTTDSRKVEKGGLFVALKGARVDGNTFIPGAYEDGAACCMSTRPPQDETRPYIQVESCEQALKDLAEYYRSVLDVTVIGITGSVGKTTTKEMIASVVSRKYDTLKTLGNFNNEIGLPLTVFRLRDNHEVAVLEMGISDFGEMGRLAKVARPDICVITNIGQCHLENLGTRDGILRAKTEVFDYLKPGGKAYLNGDDDKLSTLVNDSRISSPVFYGFGGEGKDIIPSPDVTAENVQDLGLEGTELDIVTPAGRFHVTVPAPGRHMVSNALAATAIGMGLSIPLEQIKAGIEAYRPVDGHGGIIETDRLTIMNECYNANPASMKAGLDVLAGIQGRKVAIMGDMFELGSQEEQMHYEVGEYAASKGIDVVIAVGGLAGNYEKGVRDYQQESGFDGEVYYYPAVSEFLTNLTRHIREKDTVFVKASHAMHFEKIVERLQSVSAM